MIFHFVTFLKLCKFVITLNLSWNNSNKGLFIAYYKSDVMLDALDSLSLLALTQAKSDDLLLNDEDCVTEKD